MSETEYPQENAREITERDMLKLSVEDAIMETVVQNAKEIVKIHGISLTEQDIILVCVSAAMRLVHSNRHKTVTETAVFVKNLTAAFADEVITNEEKNGTNSS